MVMDALVSGMRTSIASGSGLAHARLGTDSSRLNQEREWALGVWYMPSRDSYCRMRVVSWTELNYTHVDTSHKFSRVNFSLIPLDREKRENYTHAKNTRYAVQMAMKSTSYVSSMISIYLLQYVLQQA